MSSKRCVAQRRRPSNCFSIEALIAKDRTDDDDVEGSGKEDSEAEQRPEMQLERRDGTRNETGSTSHSHHQQPSQQRDDDDDDDDDDDRDNDGWLDLIVVWCVR